MKKLIGLLASIMVVFSAFSGLTAQEVKAQAGQITLTQFLGVTQEETERVVLSRGDTRVQVDKSAFFALSDTLVLTSQETLNPAGMDGIYINAFPKEGENGAYAYVTPDGAADRYSMLMSRYPCAMYITEDAAALFAFFEKESEKRLPETKTFHELLGVQAPDDVKYGTIEYGGTPNHTAADLSQNDMREFLKACWNVTYHLATGPYEDAQSQERFFINFWTGEKWAYNSENCGVKKTFYEDRILYGGYGKREADNQLQYSDNFIWYVLDEASREIFHTAAQKLYEAYGSKIRALDHDDGEEIWCMKQDYLPLSGASEWAKPFLNQAAGYHILPYSMTKNYTDNITREEFCELAFALINQKGLALQNAAPVFTDTNSSAVYALYSLGIINGRTDTQFSPFDGISREEAAAILFRMAKVLKTELPGTANTGYYNDEEHISEWAKTAVFTMKETGVMNGISDCDFSPKTGYTKEQAIVTMVRLYELAASRESA